MKFHMKMFTYCKVHNEDQPVINYPLKPIKKTNTQLHPLMTKGKFIFLMPLITYSRVLSM